MPSMTFGQLTYVQTAIFGNWSLLVTKFLYPLMLVCPFQTIILGVVLAYYETVTNAYWVKCPLWLLAKWHLSELQMITLSYLCAMFILVILLSLIMTNPVTNAFSDIWPNDIFPNCNIGHLITFSFLCDILNLVTLLWLIPVPNYSPTLTFGQMTFVRTAIFDN